VVCGRSPGGLRAGARPGRAPDDRAVEVDRGHDGGQGSDGAAQRRADGASNPALVEAAGRLRKAPPHAGRHGQGLGDLRQGALPWHLS